MSSAPAQREDLARLVVPLAAAAGMDVEGVEVSPAGRRRVVRIFVDKNGGVSLDEVAEVSTAIAARLDESDVLGNSPYVLEVSSPGVDRPLTLPRHWQRAVGRMVRAATLDGVELAGRVISAGDDAVVIDTDGQRGEVRYAEITKARVEVEFNRPTPDEEV